MLSYNKQLNIIVFYSELIWRKILRLTGASVATVSFSQRTGASESEALFDLTRAQSHHLSDSRAVRDVAAVINLSRWMTGRG